MRRRPEELEHPRVRAGRIGGEVVARNDQQLLSGEDLEPALELVGVAAARPVGVAPPLAAEVPRVGDEPLHLAAQPLVLGGERVLERQRLAAERDLVVVVRQRAVDRVPDQHYESRLGNNGADALRCQRVEDVARARLADELAARTRLVREVAAVPRSAARVVAVEVADLLPGRPGDRRVPAQVRVERGRAGLLRAEDQEVGQRACG